MQTKAAVLFESPGRYEFHDVEFDEPRQEELVIKMVATGICHSDEHVRAGDTIAEHYPIVCGHEGGGIVERVGPATPGWNAGDHVVFSFIPVCGRCKFCAEGLSNLCDNGGHAFRGSRFDDPASFRLHMADGRDVGQVVGLGTFSERIVVSTQSAIKVPQDLPLETLCLLSCGVGTGWGSAIYAAGTKPGDVVIVMGVGGVGMNAVQGAAMAGASAVIAVDPVDFKLNVARSLGATHAFGHISEAADFARSITNGQGADAAIVAVGVLSGVHIAEALAAVRKAGVVVPASVAPAAHDGGIPIHPREFTAMQKRIHGSLFGMCNPASDIPRQVELYRVGKLKLEPLITRRYSFDQVNEASDDLSAGQLVRGVVTFG